MLHPLASNAKVIDLGALGYALSRLPQNICTVSRVRLKRSVPKDFEKWNGVKPVQTDVWGRPTYDIGDGEIVIVIQEDTGEVLDILSLLCALTVEARKVRTKLVAAGLDKVLAEYASDGSESTTFGFKLRAAALPNAKSLPSSLNDAPKSVSNETVCDCTSFFCATSQSCTSPKSDGAPPTAPISLPSGEY